MGEIIGRTLAWGCLIAGLFLFSAGVYKSLGIGAGLITAGCILVCLADEISTRV